MGLRLVRERDPVADVDRARHAVLRIGLIPPSDGDWLACITAQ